MKARLVDLSNIITPDSAVWPGFPKVDFNNLLTIDKDGANVTIIRLITHLATHLDAPFHMIKGGQTVDLIPVQKFIGNAKLLDATKTPKGSIINNVNIKKYELDNNDIVIVKTRNSNYAENFSSYPCPSLDFGKFLLQKGVKLYCTDAPSVDEPNSKIFPFHKLMFKSGVPIVEGLVNLSKLKSDSFLLIVLPLKLAGLDGSPCRAIAIEGVNKIEIINKLSK